MIVQLSHLFLFFDVPKSDYPISISNRKRSIVDPVNTAYWFSFWELQAFYFSNISSQTVPTVNVISKCYCKDIFLILYKVSRVGAYDVNVSYSWIINSGKPNPVYDVAVIILSQIRGIHNLVGIFWNMPFRSTFYSTLLSWYSKILFV